MTIKTEGTFNPERVFQAIADIVTARARKEGLNVKFTVKSVVKKEKSGAA